MTDIASQLSQAIDRSANAINSLQNHLDTLVDIANTIITSIEADGKILTAGYGGSAADALHMAEELTGRFDRERQSLPGMALVADPTLLTCIANDYGFDHIFSRQVQGLGQPGDVLVLFSTSGSSTGLKLAIDAARSKQLKVVTFLGKTGGIVKDLADHQIIIDSNETARIQEAHTVILHLLLHAIDEHFVVEED